MPAHGEDFWEQCWQKDKERDYFAYAAPYLHMKSKEMAILQENGVHTVCDAGCGFGAYTLACVSNGFQVKSFDISPTAVSITRQLLAHYGLTADEIKTASVLATGYGNEVFDGVISYSVIDHLTVSDAKKAMDELFRITKKGGLILLAVDTADEEDLQQEHLLLDDGSIQYTSAARKGMIFHPYNTNELAKLLKGKNIIHQSTGSNGELVVILKKL